jgi:radical SAM superfamily enzyme YgiQ (UPF0313 family)
MCNYLPKIICYGTGVMDWKTTLLIVPEIHAVVPMMSIGAVTDWILADTKNQDYQDITGIAFRKDEGIYFSKRAVNDFSYIIRKTPIEECISKIDKSQAFLWGSLGCWYSKCTFCNIGAMMSNYSVGSWFSRPIDDIVNEMKQLACKGVKQILFLDAEFIGNGIRGAKRAHEFAKKVMDSQVHMEFKISCRADCVDEETFRLLKKAGLTRVFLGIESGCPKAIERYRKGVSIDIIDNAIQILKKLKIAFRTDIMLANHKSTIEEIEESLLYIRNRNLLISMNAYGVGSIFHKLHLHAGTPLYDEIADGEERLLGMELECKFEDNLVKDFYKYAMEMDEWLKNELFSMLTIIQDKKIYLGYQNYLKIISYNLLLEVVRGFKNNKSGKERKKCFIYNFEKLKYLGRKYKERIMVVGEI